MPDSVQRAIIRLLLCRRPRRHFLPLLLGLALVAGTVAGTLQQPALAGAAPPVEYYVNRRAQDSGEHEVHRAGCRYTPQERNRLPLGKFTNCRDAVREAAEHFTQVDGCYYCSPSCNHG